MLTLYPVYSRLFNRNVLKTYAAIMEAFDFNQFQRDIFKEIFNNPLQKAPERAIDMESEKMTPFVKRKNGKKVEVAKENPPKTRGRPRGRKRERSENEDFSPPSHSEVNNKSSPALTDPFNIYKTPVKINKTRFELHKEKEEIENSEKNIRRSLRAKLKKRQSVEVVIEILEKQFHEITCQEEFLHYFGLRKNN